MQIYRFRNCILNTSERILIRDDDCLQLTTKTFDVLQFLVENAGKIVTKDEILGTVWEGSFVEEGNLPVHISKLRKRLGESHGNRFIETIQGSGYRFVAPVSVASHHEWKFLAGARSNGQTRETTPHILESGVISIAVLPLHNESGDTTFEYLVDGLTENIINELSRVGNIRVIARNTVFRYKDIDVDPRDLAELLGVSKILTGRVRVVDDTLIVSVELINGDDTAQIWGGHYVRGISDLIAVQEEISFSVVENLTAARRRGNLFANSLTRDPESYRLYLRGRYLLERHSVEDIHKAIECFNSSLALDTTNIHSYAEIVECYRSLYIFEYMSYEEFLRVTEPILTGVLRGNADTDVVQVMYCDLKMLEWKFEEAAHHCRRALAINPNSLKGRLRYSDILLQSRNFGAALSQLERLMIIDPLSALIYKRLGRLFYLMGEHETGLAYLDDALDLEPSSHEALALKGAIYSETGEYEKALTNYELSLRSQYQIEMVAMMGVVYAKIGNYTKAREIIKEVKTASKRQSGYALLLAHILLALGKKDGAYGALELAYEQHEPDMRALTYDRRWDEIRNEDRFRRVVKMVGLPNVVE